MMLIGAAILFIGYRIAQAPSHLLPTPAATSSTDHSASTGHSAISTSNFAGYEYEIAVRSVAASFVVPAISTGSPDGSAATWVGVEDYSPGRVVLIQVGVSEGQDSGTATYHAIWSDTRLGYVARPISKTVRPGDLLAASVTLVRQSWRISLEDLTRGWSFTRTVTGLPVRPFHYAEWLQEDPKVLSHPVANALPYPAVGLVSFEHLRVNGVSPSLPSSARVTMRFGDGTSVSPSDQQSDGFRLSESQT